MSVVLEQPARRTSAVAEEPTVQFDRTVPRHLVHRAAVSEVFVTDLRITGENTFLVGAQWPRRHTFFGPRTPSAHDPMLFVETNRQAGLLVAHEVFGVPLDDSFLSSTKSFAISPTGLRTEDRPVGVVVAVSAHDVRYRNGRPGGMRFEFGCYREGELIGTETETWSSVSPTLYRRLRGDRFGTVPFAATALPKVDPTLVGRERAEDVVIADTPVDDTWVLQFDPDHPVLFDHPTDHVPGMVLLEGARQAALRVLADPHALPLRVDVDFDKYVEFEDPCLIVAQDTAMAADGTRIVQVRFEQNGRTVAGGTLALAPSIDPAPRLR